MRVNATTDMAEINATDTRRMDTPDDHKNPGRRIPVNVLERYALLTYSQGIL